MERKFHSPNSTAHGSMHERTRRRCVDATRIDELALEVVQNRADVEFVTGIERECARECVKNVCRAICKEEKGAFLRDAQCAQFDLRMPCPTSKGEKQLDAGKTLYITNRPFQLCVPASPTLL